MILLASCTAEQCRNFNGKLVIPNEDSGKPDKVLLNVNLEAGEEIPSNAYCVTYKGQVGKVLDGKTFLEVSLDEVESFEPVEGVITLVKMPSGYCDMRRIYNLCCERPDVRVIGGNLLGISGVRIGRFEEGKDKMSPVFCDVYDKFVEVDLGDLDGLQEIVKKTRKKVESSGTEKVKGKSSKGKSKSVSKKKSSVVAFSRLFGGSSEEF